MKLVKFAPLLLAGFLPPAYSDQYQEAIDKAFPGYRILGPSEVGLIKEEMNQDLYNRVKDHPGLAAGKFNSDKIPDFAAIIRGATKKTIPADPASKRGATDYYDGYFVVCFGRAQGGYRCHKMDETPMRITVPLGVFLARIPAGKQFCLVAWKFHAPRKPDPKRGFEPEVIDRKEDLWVTLQSDAIGLLLTSGGGDTVYVHQSKNIYLECVVTD